MSFTITGKLEQLPSYSALRKMAEEKHVSVAGNERAGSFSSRGVSGDYKFEEGRIHGKFAGHGVTGEYSFEDGIASATISDKPFWLPETLLRQNIKEGLDKFCNEQV